MRWAFKLRQTGDVAVGKVGGHRRLVLEAHEDWIRERIAAESHVCEDALNIDPTL